MQTHTEKGLCENKTIPWIKPIELLKRNHLKKYAVGFQGNSIPPLPPSPSACLTPCANPGCCTERDLLVSPSSAAKCCAHRARDRAKSAASACHRHPPPGALVPAPPLTPGTLQRKNTDLLWAFIYFRASRGRKRQNSCLVPQTSWQTLATALAKETLPSLHCLWVLREELEEF